MSKVKVWETEKDSDNLPKTVTVWKPARDASSVSMVKVLVFVSYYAGDPEL